MKGILTLIFLCISLSVAANPKKISIVSYNVHNLFDTEHDEGKNDFEYMPNDKKTCKDVETHLFKQCEKNILKVDWTKDKLELKLSQIKKALLLHNGSLPNLLALQEVENLNVVKMLADELGYKGISITESKDKRGIDVALLYNESSDLVYKKTLTHEVQSKFLTRPTRDILEVHFEIGGEDLIIFVNHWPSQGNVSQTRFAAAKLIKKRIRLLQIFKKKNIIVTGDFNVIPADHPHAFKSALLTGKGRNQLTDIEVSLKKNMSYKQKDALAFGTYFYKYGLTWNRLDRFFVSSQLLNFEGLEADKKSFKVISNQELTAEYTFKNKEHFLYGTTVKNIPAAYKHNESTASKAGYSDHFPVYMEIFIK